jgi:hypothetical protein
VSKQLSPRPARQAQILRDATSRVWAGIGTGSFSGGDACAENAIGGTPS